MLLSMTGYGRSSRRLGDKNISVEIKSLNGKTSDLRLRVPANFKEKEITIRKIILQGCSRGKIDANVEIASESGENDFALNKTLFDKYLNELKELDLPSDSNTDYVQAILRIPNVIKADDKELDEEEWKVILEVTEEALANLTNFRKEEGDMTKIDFHKRVSSIQNNLEEIAPYESRRVDKLKERLKSKLEEYISNEKVDPNRYEQEVIYYLEKLDINEEKVRLSQHCKYFLEVLDMDNAEKGKKLGFISQEMGREINTLGAKAQDADIQQRVVGMKDELEKIKEQVLNII